MRPRSGDGRSPPPAPGSWCSYGIPESDRRRRTMKEYQYLATEEYDDGQIFKILLNRPETRNAQNPGLLYELEQAFLETETDDRVRVLILGGVGPSFSSG